MIAMTQENTKRLMNSSARAIAAAADQTTKSWDKRERAVKAAIAALGPQAIPEFDFTVFKCDKRWMWRPVAEDKRPPVTELQRKASGGKKAVVAMVGASDKKAENIVFATRAPKEKSITKREKETQAWLESERDRLAPALEEIVANRSPEAVQIAATVASKLATELTGTPAEKLALEINERAAKDLAAVKIDLTEDSNGMPAFLKREGDNSDAARDERINRMKRTIGPERKIKNPPNATKRSSVKGPAGPASEQRADGLKAGSSGAILVDRVCLKEGATNEELCKAVGWKECLPAMKKYAAKAGVTITTKKVKGEPTRYFGTR